MTHPRDAEFDLETLQADWQVSGPALAPAEQIRDHVRKRGRWIAAWLAGDLIVGTIGIVALTARLLTSTDVWDRLAMTVLTAMTAGAVIFTWWNWRGALRASSETTHTFVNLSLDRSRRFARAAKAGWLVLAIEALIFVPWVAHQLYGSDRTPSAADQTFAWAFLGVMLGLGAWCVARLQQWTRRDAQVIAEILTELDRV